MNMKKNTAPALRSYQLEALSAMKAADAHFHRTLLCLATGGGKTLTAVEHVKRWYLDAGKHVLWIAHSSELLDQAFKTLLQAGIPAEWVCRRYGKYDEVCAKSARVYLVNNLVKWQAPKANLVVIDEAHHAAAGTYRKWLEQQQRVYRHDPRVLGLTATPFRLHHGEIQSLCDFRLTKQKSLFQTVVYEKSFCELVAAGYLAPFHHIRFETKMRFTLDMGSTGDFTDRSLDTLNVAPRNRLIVEQWRRSRKEFGPTLVFVGTKEHARALAACFGEDAQCLLSDHDAEERKRILRAFASGQVPVLVNVRMITEGVDLPNIRTVVLARPTASAVLFTQMVGRGSRLSGGKSYFNLVDIHDQLGEHERYLATTAYLGGCRNPDLVASVARQGGPPTRPSRSSAWPRSRATRQRWRPSRRCPPGRWSPGFAAG